MQKPTEKPMKVHRATQAIVSAFYFAMLNVFSISSLTHGAVNVLHFVRHDSMRHTLHLLVAILDNCEMRGPSWKGSNTGGSKGLGTSLE